MASVMSSIVCNECDAEIRSVPAAELQQTLTEMELTLDLCSAACPHCGAVNLFPGFRRSWHPRVRNAEKVRNFRTILISGERYVAISVVIPRSIGTLIGTGEAARTRDPRPGRNSSVRGDILDSYIWFKRTSIQNGLRTNGCDLNLRSRLLALCSATTNGSRAHLDRGIPLPRSR